MSDKDLKIKITTLGDPKGAEDVHAALTKIAKATGESGNSSEEAGKKSEKFGLKMGELKKVAHELGEEFPLAAEALRLFLNPIGASITIAISFFSAMKEKIDEVNKALDEAGERAARPDFIVGIEAKKKALQEQAVEAAKAADAMANLISPEEAYQAALGTTITLLHEKYAAQQAVNNAAKGAELAQVAMMEAMGMDHDKAIAMNAAIEKSYRDKEVARKAAERQENIHLNEEAGAHALGQMKLLKPQVEQNDNAVNAASTADARARAELEQALEDKAEIDRREKAATEKFDSEEASIREWQRLDQRRRKGLPNTPGENAWLSTQNVLHPFTTGGDLDRMVEESDAARKAQSDNLSETRRLTRATDADEGPLAVARQRAARTLADYEASQKEFEKLKTENDRLHKSDALATSAEAAIKASEDKTAQAGALAAFAKSPEGTGPDITPHGAHGLLSDTDKFRALNPGRPLPYGADYQPPAYDIPGYGGVGGGDDVNAHKAKLAESEAREKQLTTIINAAQAQLSAGRAANMSGLMNLLRDVLAQEARQRAEIDRLSQQFSHRAANNPG